LILVDANILIYAYDPDSPQHDASRRWVEETFSGPFPIRIAWLTALAFLRITTSPRVFHRPLTIGESEGIVSSWLCLPAVSILPPGQRFWEILRGLLHAGQASGPLVMDAALAALALEHGATLYTTDQDFSRFRGLKVVNPLAN